MAEDIVDPVSGDEAYDALALIIAENNPYAAPDDVEMPDLTGTLQDLKDRKVKIAGWLRDRVAKPDGSGNFVSETGNLTQVCNDQMTISDKQQSFYWTMLIPTDQDVPVQCPGGSRNRNEPPTSTKGAEATTYQVCKAIFIPIHYKQVGDNGPSGQPQKLEGGIIIGYVGAGGH